MKITPNSVLVFLSVLASAHAFMVPQKNQLAGPTCLPKVTPAPKHGDSTSLSMIEFPSELVAGSGVNLYNVLLPFAIFAYSIALSVKNSSPRVEIDWTATKAGSVAFAQPKEETPVTVAAAASIIALSVKNSSPRVEIDSTATRKAEPIALVQPQEETHVTVAPVAKATPKPAGIRSFSEIEKLNYMAAIDEREALRCKEVDVPATKAKPSVVIQTFRFFRRGFAFPFRGLKKLFS
jgi:hypothetical protein